MKLRDRMPPLDPAAMTDAQRRAAEELTAGPRGGVKGPFIPLLRSPELMDRLQKVGDVLVQRTIRPGVDPSELLSKQFVRLSRATIWMGTCFQSGRMCCRVVRIS